MYNTIPYMQNHGNISPLAETCMVHFAVKYSDDLHQQDHKTYLRWLKLAWYILQLNTQMTSTNKTTNIINKECRSAIASVQNGQE